MNFLQSYLALYPSFLKDKFVKTNILVASSLNLAIWLWLIWQTKDFSGHIPLHYNIYFGIDSLGPWQNLLFLPLFGLLFLVINLVFGVLSFEKEKMLGYFLMGTASMVQILILFSVYFVIFINS